MSEVVEGVSYDNIYCLFGQNLCIIRLYVGRHFPCVASRSRATAYRTFSADRGVLRQVNIGTGTAFFCAVKRRTQLVLTRHGRLQDKYTTTVGVELRLRGTNLLHGCATI